MAEGGTVKLPGIGPVKKQTALALAGVAGVVVIIAVYRSKKAAAAGTTAAATTDPNAVDPATGLTYAQEAAGGTGGYGIDPATGVPYAQEAGGGGYGYGSGVAYPVTPGGGSTGGLPLFTDNASWAQYAESYMVNQLGGDPNTIGNALGKYITGQPVTAAQQSLVEQAIAFAGQPPVNGQGGFPPSMHLQSTGGGGGGGGGGGKKVIKQHTVTADGKSTFQDIANDNGVTEAELKTANPQIARQYEGTGHPVRKGTRVVIPEHTVKS